MLKICKLTEWGIQFKYVWSNGCFLFTTPAFSDCNVPVITWGILLKFRFSFSRSEMGLRICMSKFPEDTHATLHRTMLCGHLFHRCRAQSDNFLICWRRVWFSLESPCMGQIPCICTGLLRKVSQGSALGLIHWLLHQLVIQGL